METPWAQSELWGTIGPMGTPSDPMGFHAPPQTAWPRGSPQGGAMGALGDLWGLMETHAPHGDPMRPHAAPWGSMGAHGGIGTYGP